MGVKFDRKNGEIVIHKKYTPVVRSNDLHKNKNPALADLALIV